MPSVWVSGGGTPSAWTQLCPETMLPEVEKAADTQAWAEGSESPTPSIGLLPRQ